MRVKIWYNTIILATAWAWTARSSIQSLVTIFIWIQEHSSENSAFDKNLPVVQGKDSFPHSSLDTCQTTTVKNYTFSGPHAIWWINAVFSFFGNLWSLLVILILFYNRASTATKSNLAYTLMISVFKIQLYVHSYITSNSLYHNFFSCIFWFWYTIFYLILMML